jgi:diadenosine tetraphosphatase ApaH/serine/threonine PP2A family protein phosphatase
LRYAILSDVHGNLEALNAVIDHFAPLDVDRFVCLGDVVGYGADPRDCIDRLQRLGAICLLGNHDAAAVDLIRCSSFNTYAATAIEWTRKVLDGDDRRFLRDLPFVVIEDDLSLAHASLHHPEWFAYVRTLDDILQCFEAQSTKVAFIGHSHVPAAYVLRDGQVGVTFDPDVEVATADKAVLNVGSVGQPRDQDPRASCALYDSAEERYELFRVPYDVATAAAKIARAGLPSVLGERLKVGA